MAPLVAACKKKTLEYPGLPLFIFGHSMGGLVVLSAVLQNPGLFDGMVLTGPVIDSATDNPVTRLIGSKGSVLCPGCSIGFIRGFAIEDLTRSKVGHIQLTRYFYSDYVL